MAIDKLNFSGINSGSDNFVSPVGSLSDRLMKYGNYMVTQGNEEERLKLQQEKDAYQRGRDAITDARLNKQEARQDKEQAANDLFYTEFAKGQQNKGGLYGDLIAKESDKYAFTNGEIGLATEYKNDPLLARAAGQNALADKIDWQLKAGDANIVGRFVDSNIDDETRPERYDRISSLISSKGYTPPKELIIAADQAILAERTAEEAKAKLLDDQRSDIIKNQRSDLWKNVSYSGSGDTSTGTDSEGNQIQINTSKGASAQNRFNNGFNDDLSKGSNDITEAIAKNTKGATDTSKSLTSSDALKFYNKLVKEEGIDPSVAAAQIVNGISSKDPKWHQWMTDKEAKFNKDAIAQLLPTLKETSEIKRKTDIANGTNTVISSKEEAANNLLKTLAENDEVNLSKINADRAKLLLTPEERRTAKANQWLEREGILGKQKELISPENNVFNTGQGYSDNESIIKKIANNETGGVKGSAYAKIHDSGALGKYGFVPTTALEQMQQLGFKGTKEELLNQFISTPSIQDKVMNNYVNVNTKTLSSSGVPVTDWTIWTAHNLGAGNAIKLAKGNIDEDVISAISKNLPKGVKPTVSNYQELWFEKTNLGDESKTYKDDVKDRLLNSEDDSLIEADASTIKKIDNGAIKNLISGSESKDRFPDNKVLETYADKKAIQDAELSKSAYSRTFGAKEEIGKYGKIWNDSDSKKGSSLSKNVSTLSSALDNDGFSSFEEVNKLYNSMPSGVDKDAVGELLNYKGMQGSQEWRDMKARQQYLEAGLTAASTIPIPAGLFARGLAPVAEKVVAPIISGTVEKSAPLQIASDRAKLSLPDLNVGKGTSTVNNGLSLPDYKVGSRQWSNPNSVVTTDKMSGRGISDVIEMSAPEQRAIQAQRQAIASKKSLDKTIPTNASDLNYFGKELLSRNVQIADQKLKEFVNSGGKLSTKEGKRLKEEADKALLDYNRKYFYK